MAKRRSADASRSRSYPRTGSLAGPARRRGTEAPASESVAACRRDRARGWTRARGTTPRPETLGGGACRQRTRRWYLRRHHRHALRSFLPSPPTNARPRRAPLTTSSARLRPGRPDRDDRSTARAVGWLGVSSRAPRCVRRGRDPPTLAFATSAEAGIFRFSRFGVSEIPATPGSVRSSTGVLKRGRRQLAWFVFFFPIEEPRAPQIRAHDRGHHIAPRPAQGFPPTVGGP